MRVTRTTPLAINKPLLVLGVERAGFAVLLIAGALIGAKFNRVIGISLFFLGFAFIKRITRKDPRAFEIFRVRLRMKPLYCPIKRVPFQMEVSK